LIIDIQDELFSKILAIVKGRNIKVYEELQQLPPLKLNTIDTLATARAIKTDRIKESIRTTLIELMQSETKPSKYKVHKRTNIAYITLNKYYDDILDEVLSDER